MSDLDFELHEKVASIWLNQGETSKTFNEAWQFIEAEIYEQEKAKILKEKESK